ncbi:hypothetical protein LZ30DRAFT_439177 [Colletotrichum cereale]|nr:hypothetical protein LZ30DRAFT_439177 [Colletotrichum cereale]
MGSWGGETVRRRVVERRVWSSQPNAVKNPGHPSYRSFTSRWGTDRNPAGWMGASGTCAAEWLSARAPLHGHDFQDMTPAAAASETRPLRQERTPCRSPILPREIAVPTISGCPPALCDGCPRWLVWSKGLGKARYNERQVFTCGCPASDALLQSQFIVSVAAKAAAIAAVFPGSRGERDLVKD